LQAQGAASDGKHGSNVTAILESLAADPEKAKAAADYGFSKYVAELSLEELMAANLSGDGRDKHPTHCIACCGHSLSPASHGPDTTQLCYRALHMPSI
jgi:hypothetical protein